MSRHRPTLVWLSEVLTERFGFPIIAEFSGNGDEVCLRVKKSSKSVRMAGGFKLFDRKADSIPCAQWTCSIAGWTDLFGASIPAPGIDSCIAPMVEESEHGLYLHYPLPGMIWWMLSRREELNCVDLDHHQRFPASASHAFRHGYLNRPVVDEWLHVLGLMCRESLL